MLDTSPTRRRLTRFRPRGPWNATSSSECLASLSEYLHRVGACARRSIPESQRECGMTKVLELFVAKTRDPNPEQLLLAEPTMQGLRASLIVSYDAPI